MVHPEYRPQKPQKQFTGRLYGFKIHPSAYDLQGPGTKAVRMAQVNIIEILKSKYLKWYFQGSHDFKKNELIKTNIFVLRDFKNHVINSRWNHFLAQFQGRFRPGPCLRGRSVSPHFFNQEYFRLNQSQGPLTTYANRLENVNIYFHCAIVSRDRRRSPRVSNERPVTPICALFWTANQISQLWF